MTIQVIYKVLGLPGEYESEQEAMVAEAVDQCEGLYIESYNMRKLVKAITSKYFLVPHSARICGYEEKDEMNYLAGEVPIDNFCGEDSRKEQG